jgi:hypothetical protein
VGGPSSVSNAGVRVEGLCEVDTRAVNELLELGHFANLLEGKDLILLVTIDGQTSRVVATVF